MIRVLLLVSILVSSLFSFEIYIDESETLNINQIIKKNIEYKSSKGIAYTIDHTDKPIWIKEKLINNNDTDKTFIINLRPTIIQKAQFYRVFDGKIEIYKNLDRKFLTIDVPHNTTVDVYVKFYHSDSLVIFETFSSFMDYIYKYESKLVENLIFLTILIIIAIYSLVLYYHIRKRYFLYYIVYILSFAIGFSTYTVVWPLFFYFEPSFLFFNMCVGIMYISSLLFIDSITKYTTNFPQYKKILVFIFCSIAIFMIVAIFDFQRDITSYLMRFNMILNVLFILWIIINSLKKVKIAKHLLIGWGAYSIAIAINNLLHFGLLPYNFITTNAFEFGVIFENFVFAYALGLQLKLINDERIELLKDKHEKESFFNAQSKFALAGQVLFQIEHEWRRPLSYIPAITSSLQSKIFTNQTITPSELSEKLVEVDKTVKNIQNTMEEFKRFYTPDKYQKNIKLHKTIIDSIEYFKKVTLSADILVCVDAQEITLDTYKGDWQHIILNLLQNSVDFSRDKSDIKILIKLIKKENSIEFIYEDNSGGTIEPSRLFEPFYSNDDKSGIGLFMLRYIVTQRLNGTISAQNHNNGLKTTIKLQV